MKALTVSSEGSRVLKVGTGGLESLALPADLSADRPPGCCATANETRRRTTEQQSQKRCIVPFLRADPNSQRRPKQSSFIFIFHYTPVLAAMGKRRPEPKAFGEIFSPGAACWRLYSARSTMRITRCTSARS